MTNATKAVGRRFAVAVAAVATAVAAVAAVAAAALYIAHLIWMNSPF